MLDKDYENLVISNFDRNIPDIFIDQIKQTFDNSKKHLPQLKGLYFFYRSFRYNLPPCYLSKSRIRVGDDGLADMFCKNPFVDGTIENLTLLLEKQFFDIVYLLLGGIYRPIHVILRYMLELTSWATISLINKKQLTGILVEHKKAMSIFEFEKFLETNMNNIEKRKSPLIPKQEKKKLKTFEGLSKIPEEYVKFINFNNLHGMKAVKLLHSKLSKYAHANVWSQLRSDGGNNETSVDKSGMYVSTPSFEGYHKILPLIIKTHEVIFHMLFIASYENLIYFNEKEAKEFANDTKELTKSLESFSLKFPDLEKLTMTIFAKQKGAIDWSKKLEKIPDPNFDEIIDEERKLVCSKCECEVYFEDELCHYCHYLEIGSTQNTEDIFL